MAATSHGNTKPIRIIDHDAMWIGWCPSCSGRDHGYAGKNVFEALTRHEAEENAKHHIRETGHEEVIVSRQQEISVRMMK